jgi:hypothetical protein
LQTNVVPSNGRAVFKSATDCDFEFAWQESKLWMQGAPLSKNFAVRPGVNDFIGGNTCKTIARDVADTVAAGLDAVHVNVSKGIHDVGALSQGDPVVLKILTGGEVPVAAVKMLGNMSQSPQLLTAELTVGHSHTQHRRMALHIPAILQTERTKFIITQFTREIALQLVAELRRALTDKPLIKF